MNNDQQYLRVLHLISKIELRTYPAASRKYNFGEEFKSDIRMIKSLCRSQSSVSLRSQYLNDRWDIVILLSSDFFLFYLPSILLACIERPERSLASCVVDSKNPSKIPYTAAEENAYWAMVKYIEQERDSSQGA